MEVGVKDKNKIEIMWCNCFKSDSESQPPLISNYGRDYSAKDERMDYTPFYLKMPSGENGLEIYVRVIGNIDY